MKKLLTVFLAALLLSGLTACGEDTSAEAKFVPDEVTVEIFFNGELQGMQKMKYTYDENWNTTELANYYDGVLEMTMKLSSYAENGKPAEMTAIAANGDANNQFRYTYDEEDRIIKQETVENGEVTQYTESTYNEKGNLATQSNYLAIVDMTTLFEYSYDQNGNRTETKTYRNGELISVEVIEYDSKGRVLKETTYIGDTNDIQLYTEYTYDDSANTCTAVTTGVSEGYGSSITKLTYDDHGNEILMELYADNELRQRTTYTWIQTE